MRTSTSAGSAAARSSAVGYRANSAGVAMFTRTSVVCAERIVAVSSWKASAWSSSQRASGYSSFSRSLVPAPCPSVSAVAPSPAGYGRVTLGGWPTSDGWCRRRRPRTTTARPRPGSRHAVTCSSSGGRSRRDATRAECRRSRPGVPAGVDEDAWLEVNNRSFAAHPDQGEPDASRLEAKDGTVVRPRRVPAARRDPDGPRAGHLDGFCWTKVHAGHDPPVGEIFVIGVDPSAHGRGLGGALTVAGPRPPRRPRAHRQHALRRRVEHRRPEDVRPPRLHRAPPRPRLHAGNRSRLHEADVDRVAPPLHVGRLDRADDRSRCRRR